MKVFVLNGRKAAYTLFGTFCFLVLVYVGFLPQIDSVVASADITQTTYVAIVIEGFGSGLSGTKEFLYMDIPYTGAVMQEKPYTDEEIRLLSNDFRNVFVYIDGATNKNFNNIDGISIKSTNDFLQNQEIVLELMTFAKNNNLIVIDTEPTKKRIAKEISAELGVIFFEKDIILDDTNNISKIEQNLKKASKIADRNGHAIVIGDLGNNTGKSLYQAIKNVSATFQEKNIEFVTLSELARRLKD